VLYPHYNFYLLASRSYSTFPLLPSCL
jgi:hypothetical protein